MQPPSKKYAQEKWIMSPQSFGVKKCMSNHLFDLLLEPKWPFPINTRVIWVLGTFFVFLVFSVHLQGSKTGRSLHKDRTKTVNDAKRSSGISTPGRPSSSGRSWLRFNNDVETTIPQLKWGMVWKITRKMPYKNSGCSPNSQLMMLFERFFSRFGKLIQCQRYLSDTFKFHTLPTKKWEASNLIGSMYGMFTYVYHYSIYHTNQLKV